MAIMTPARRKIAAARADLIITEPFFGTLALQLRLVEDKTCETAWTDGTSLGYNPEYIEGLSQDEAKGLVGHEVMHNAMKHPWRRGLRQPYRWNVACDYAIDSPLQKNGFRVPDALINPAWDNKSAEWIYAQLPPSQGGQGGQQGQGGGSGQPGKQGQGKGQGQPRQGCGEVRDAPTAGTSEAEWNVMLVQAAEAAKAAGNLPAQFAHLVTEVTKPQIDWKATLRLLVQQQAKDDYTWTQPSRRYLSLGLYLPSIRSEQMPPIAVAFDTSGSVSNMELAAFIAETQSILDEVRPSSTVLIQCDAAVNHVEEIDPGESIQGIKIHGRGGTSFRPVFEHIEKEEIQPACLIYLTDMMPCDGFPEEPEEYPVFWVSTTPADAPFGETLHLLDGGVDR